MQSSVCSAATNGRPIARQEAVDLARTLVVDDEPPICDLLRHTIESIGLGCDTCSDARKALSIAASGTYDLILSDLRMPGMSGLDLLREVKERNLNAGFVMVTGCDDVHYAIEALRLGALDYVLKPFSVESIRDCVRRAAGRWGKAADLLKWNDDFVCAIEEQHHLLRLARDEVQTAAENALESLVAAIEAREGETTHHSKRVSEYAAYLSALLGHSSNDQAAIRIGALLHDIGKLGVPDHILLKRGPLTTSEWAIMRMHPEIGTAILKPMADWEGPAEIVLCHHEHFDGNGYPRGLTRAGIPAGARVLSVADAYDAMTSNRPYRPALTHEQAVAEMAHCAGSQFDPEIVPVFTSVPAEVWAEIRMSVTIFDRSSGDLEMARSTVVFDTAG